MTYTHTGTNMHDIGWQNRHRTPKYTDMQGTRAFIA